MIRLLVSLVAGAVAVSAQASQTATAAPPTPKARLEGRVLNQNTGEPVRKANLHLRMLQALGMGAVQPDMSMYVVASDAEGKFVFDDLDPGRYTLSADRAGYVRQTYGARSSNSGGTNLTLDSGQEMKDIVFKLVPQATISGKVTDEDGDLINGGFVQVLRSSYTRGVKQLVPYGSGSVQPDGAFLIGNLAAGRYYISASDSNSMGGGGVPERYGRKGPETGYATTYFPNALDIESAAPVDIAAGAELRGIEIHLRKVQIFHVRGKVVANVAGTDPQNQLLFLTRKNDGEVFSYQRWNASTRGRDAAFEFRHLIPGTYVIQNNVTRGAQGAIAVAHYEVTVSDQDVNDLVVPLTAGIEITGTMKVEGSDSLQVSAPQQPAAAPAAQPSITLQPIQSDPNFGSPFARANDDGTFQIRGIIPNKYRLSTNQLPDGTYIKTIRFGGQDITKTDLDLTAGTGGAIEILLSPNASDVSGVVRNDNGEAVPGVMVSLWNPGTSSDPPKIANTDQNGAFKIRNLGPGEYRVAAFEDIEPGLIQDPDFRQRFDTQAITVKIGENAHENDELKMISKAAIDAEVAKIK